MLRNPAVAGQFYSSSGHTLRSEVEQYIDKKTKKEQVMGVVSPHAGYMYSGPVAGAVYSRIKIPGNVIIIGPNHTGLGREASIMNFGEWDMPNGKVEINTDLAKAILVGSKYLQDDHLAHLREHSLEVQLPFIQYFRQEFKIVPIAMMSTEYDVCEDIGKAVAQASRISGEDILIVASSDMTHYESQSSAEKKDKKAIDEILKLNPKGLYDTVIRNRITMCGFAPVTAMLIACLELGATQSELVKYATSGDVSGDYDQVVGYAGVIIK